MTDQITVPRELLRQVLVLLDKALDTDNVFRKLHNDAMDCIHEIKTLLDAPAQEPAVWNQVQVCTWIGNQLMTQPSMFERNAVCKFVRSLGRNEKLAKYFPAPQAQQPNGWLRAIDEEMVSTHLGVADITDSYEDAKRKLNTLICWHVDVSHDPKVNGSAQQPRKAVKLTDYQISCIAVDNSPDVHIYARAIEQAVWEKLGVTE